MIEKREFKPNPQVLARMAEVFAQNGIIKKTHLHFASRTDWNSFEKYLDWMQDKNYIEYHDSRHAYQLTSSGREMFGMILKFHEHVQTAKVFVHKANPYTLKI